MVNIAVKWSHPILNKLKTEKVKRRKICFLSLCHAVVILSSIFYSRGQHTEILLFPAEIVLVWKIISPSLDWDKPSSPDNPGSGWIIKLMGADPSEEIKSRGNIMITSWPGIFMIQMIIIAAVAEIWTRNNFEQPC